MRTTRSILRNRVEDAGESLMDTRSTSSPDREENDMVDSIKNRLRSKFTLEGPETAQNPNHFYNELYKLRNQNIMLKRGRRSSVRAETARKPSTDTLNSGGTLSLGSTRSWPDGKEPVETQQSTSAEEPPSFTHPLSTLSLLPKPRRLNVLETLVRAFPITIPVEEFVNFVDAKGYPELTDDMKRYFTERKNQHQTEFERYVSVFKSERPWEPKWFTNFLGKLLVSTKARPSVYQYIFDVRKRREESKVLQKWRELSVFLKWTIFVVALLVYFVMMCFLIEIYEDEGINMSIPITLFVTIVLNKVFVNMNCSLPSGM